MALLGQAILFDTRPGFGVPFRILLLGSCTSFVLLCTLRMFFPPMRSGRAKIARVSPAAPVQKQNVMIAGLVLVVIHHMRSW
jgi:hypothetical protein